MAYYLSCESEGGLVIHGGRSLTLDAWVGNYLTMRIREKVWLGLMIWIGFKCLDNISGITFWVLLICFIKKSYLENQSLRRKVWGFGGILFLNSRTLWKEELPMWTSNWWPLMEVKLFGSYFYREGFLVGSVVVFSASFNCHWHDHNSISPLQALLLRHFPNGDHWHLSTKFLYHF